MTDKRYVCPSRAARRGRIDSDGAGSRGLVTALLTVLALALPWRAASGQEAGTDTAQRPSSDAEVSRPDALPIDVVQSDGMVPLSGSPFSIHDSLRTRASERLLQHVDAQRLRAWRDTCKAEAADAFDFLFAWLPPSDLSAWRADHILDDIELALQTRRESPWVLQIPDGIFLTYVLPHRVAQEPIEPWRPAFKELLWDRVNGLTLREAVLETNRFCREHATFRPSCPRDQGPLTTAEKGIGRCEEEMIFFICAARSVGIPARPCYTPAWMAGDNNHAWVEAWTGDGWHYLGACEPAPDLNMAWFTGPARRAGLVLSVAYGEEGAPGEDVYNSRLGATLINSTAVYTTPGTVRVAWGDLVRDAQTAQGAARDTIWVTVHVFNWGSLSPLGRFRAGDGILLGPGDYVLSCEVDEIPIATKVTVEPDTEASLVFDPKQPDSTRMGWLEIPFRLNIPDPDAEAKARREEAARQDSTGSPDSDSAADERPEAPRVAPVVQQMHEANLARRDLERMRNSVIPPSTIAELAARMTDPADAAGAQIRGSLEALLSHLEAAGPRAPQWARLATGVDEQVFPIARDLLLAMDEKDFFEADTLEAAEGVKVAHAVRSWRARWEPPIPDSLWVEFVLSPRIDHQPGDAGMWTLLPLMTLREGAAVPVDDMLVGMGEIPAPAEFIHAYFADRVVQEPEYRLGHLNRPSEAWRLIDARSESTVTAPLARASGQIAMIGLLRRNGIPARVDAERRWVEIWDEGKWIPADPFDTDSWNRKEGAVAEAYAEPAFMRVDFLDQGGQMLQAEGWKHFRLARWSGGLFEPLRAGYPVANGRLEMPLEPGTWWLFGGQRDESGSPWVHARRFQASAGDTLGMAFEIGAPSEEIEPALPPMKQIPMEAVRSVWSELGRRSPVLLFVWARDSEPCIRTADALASGWSFVDETGVSVVSCLLDEASGPYPRDIIPRSTVRMSITGDEMREWFGIERIDALPVTAWIDEEGRTLLHLEGMQLAVIDLLRRTARDAVER